MNTHRFFIVRGHGSDRIRGARMSTTAKAAMRRNRKKAARRWDARDGYRESTNYRQE